MLRTLTEEEKKQIRPTVDAIARYMSGKNVRVVAPALVVVLTELAKNDGIPLEVLLEHVRGQYSVAVGDLWPRPETD